MSGESCARMVIKRGLTEVWFKRATTKPHEGDACLGGAGCRSKKDLALSAPVSNQMKSGVCRDKGVATSNYAFGTAAR